MFLKTLLLVVPFYTFHIVLFQRKMIKKKYQKSKYNATENFFFCYFEVMVREHVGTQGSLTREHVRHVSKSAHKVH